MAKKQVAVSLRKPPSPEKLDAFVNAVETSAPPSSGVQAVAVNMDAPTPATPGVTAAPKAAAAAEENIAAQAAAPPEATPAPPEATPAPPLVDAEGRTLHAVTVHLPQALAERLTLHCIEHDRDMSNVVGDALDSHLQRRLNAGRWTPPRAAEAPPPRTGPFGGASPFGGADAFAWAEAFRGGRRVEALLQLSRALLGLWRQRPWAA